MSPAEQSAPPALLDRPLDKARLRVDLDLTQYAMVPLSLQVLLPEDPLPCDIYLPLWDRLIKDVHFEKVGNLGETFRSRWRENLLTAGSASVYLQEEDLPLVNGYFSKRVGAFMDNDTLPLRKKAVVVQEVAALNLRMFFTDGLTKRTTEEVVANAKDTVQTLVGNYQILNNLSQVLKIDYSIYIHSINVCMLALALGRYLGMDDSRLHALGLGALLHDVGMSRCSHGLLNKPHELSVQEMQQVRRHPREGYQMLLNVGAVPYDSLMIILHHHENADGSGYPGNLKVERIPYLARLVRVVDAFDAMTSNRPYRDATSAYQAAATLVEDSSHLFGRDLVVQFVKFLASPYLAWTG